MNQLAASNWGDHIKLEQGQQMAKINNIHQQILDNDYYQLFKEFNIEVKCKKVSDMIDDNNVDDITEKIMFLSFSPNYPIL